MSIAPTLRLLCARPLFRTLDLQSTRFVVAKACGLVVGGQKLEMGDEVPPGSLNTYALQCEYERPLCRIDALTYALTVDGLREAVTARGVKETEPEAEAPQVVKPDLEALDRKGLQRLCELYGLDPTGSARLLKQRLEAHLK